MIVKTSQILDSDEVHIATISGPQMTEHSEGNHSRKGSEEDDSDDGSPSGKRKWKDIPSLS